MAGRLESIAIGACRRFNTANGALSARAIPASRSKTSRHSVAAINPCLPTASMTDRYHSAIFSRIQQRSFHATSTTSDNPTEKTVTSEDKAPAIASEPACSPKVEELFQKIIWLDMIELHLLAELINEKLGLKISDAEKERMARGGGGKKAADDGDDAPAEVKEEKTAFDLKLTGFDAKAKIKVIKEIRGITSLGLKEAKELVEGAPTTVKKQIKMEEAEELKKKLEEVGATVEIV